MRDTATIFTKEFRGYFSSPIAYIFITVFLVLANWLFFRVFFLMEQASVRPLFTVMPWMFLFFVPAITMRLWAEEKKLGTMELLMTLPVKDHAVVLGKFLAALVFLGLTVLLTLPLVLTVGALGDLDTGPVVGGYLGALLMGAAYLAIGLFASSLTENQIVAFIVGVVLIFGLLVIGEDLVIVAAPAALAPLLSYLGLGTHFESIGRGVIDSRDVLYYLSVIFFFVFLNVRSIESRKWK